MINFYINQKAVEMATKRINENNKRETQVNVCLEGLVCPICTKDLEKCIDDNRNINYKCTSDTCDFIWPPTNRKIEKLC